ncbi:hypothetical protein [Pseudoalteromonas luteoviolacea]|nr:hypothetical protein [Pseudoalteromonas luteoviolacea]
MNSEKINVTKPINLSSVLTGYVVTAVNPDLNDNRYEDNPR